MGPRTCPSMVPLTLISSSVRNTAVHKRPICIILALTVYNLFYRTQGLSIHTVSVSSGIHYYVAVTKHQNDKRKGRGIFCFDTGVTDRTYNTKSSQLSVLFIGVKLVICPERTLMEDIRE